jgi:hypothetical protein
MKYLAPIPQNYTLPITYTSMDDIVSNIKDYAEQFVSDGFVVFKGANFTQQEHVEFTNIFGSELGFHFGLHSEKIETFKENYEWVSNIENLSKNETIFG